MESKYIKAILKLNRLTKEDQITWNIERYEPNSLTGTEELRGNSFTTFANDRKFRLYKFETKHYTDENVFDWIPNFRLEFIDDRGRGGWEFPQDRSIMDLYETVLYKTSGAEDFIDDFLDEDDLK